MYLKTIKAQGFKSFADKINIELDNKITGIVGPNGSGKSNVVDAVRWVLGEQSVKSLRGSGTMTDVIFSGSKTRTPSNVASVTLVLDNSDHFIPLDYNEVAIKRRVYKDSTNEYFINGEKVRLKDITNILLDSGMAKESFNIISQGKIEEILSNKPEDRRIIFEEAAGVLKYKKRKEEALRKLDRTHTNMNRVNDIISELEIQVEPLKDQKEKALEYQKVSDELASIEIALVTNDITDLNYQYKQTKTKIDDLNDEISKISSTSSNNEAKITEYKFKISQLEEQIKDKQAEVITLTTKVEQSKARKSIILERQKYNVEDSKLRDNLLALKEKELQLQNEETRLTELKNNLSLDIRVIEEKQGIETKKIQTCQTERQVLEVSLKEQLRHQNNLNIKIESLRSSIDNNSSLPFAVKKVLDNPKLRGIHNVIGNLIEVEEQYSLAISTALGMNNSNIVVADEISAKEAINYLKTNNIGRATFFPLNIIKARGIEIDLNNLPGLVDTADRLTKFDSKYTNIVLNQLGNILVVDNLDNANTIAKRINYRYRIVTLDGQILNVGGSLTGGNSNKTKNVILEKYDLENCIKEFNTINDLISSIENNINEKDHQLKSFEDKLYLINKDKVDKTVTLDNITKILADVKENLKMTSLEIYGTDNILKGELTKEEELVLNEYYLAVKEKETVANELNNLNKVKLNLNEELDEIEGLSKKDNSLFTEKNLELKELEILVNRLDVKLDNLLNTLTETYNLTYEAAISKYKLEIPENIARTTVNSLRRKIKELGIVNLGSIEEYDRISTRYEFLIKQRDDLTNAENTLLEIIDEMDKVMEKDFAQTFKIIQSNFTTTFKELFKGGTAELKLTDPNNILETGIEIIASPPGKKLSSISLLSGGEKTFTAISLLFAILKSKPVPFCILDEVEAALDESNVDSFGNYLRGLKDKTQFILITHKKRTMEYVDVLYGITMQESGVSKLVSVKLEDVK